MGLCPRCRPLKPSEHSAAETPLWDESPAGPVTGGHVASLHRAIHGMSMGILILEFGVVVFLELAT